MIEFLPYILGAIGGAVTLGGVGLLLKSKTGQAVEADAETAAFNAAEKSVEWLSDKTSHMKAIAAEQAKMARKDQLKAQLLQKLQQ